MYMYVCVYSGSPSWNLSPSHKSPTTLQHKLLDPKRLETQRCPLDVGLGVQGFKFVGIFDLRVLGLFEFLSF